MSSYKNIAKRLILSTIDESDLLSPAENSNISKDNEDKENKDNSSMKD